MTFILPQAEEFIATFKKAMPTIYRTAKLLNLFLVYFCLEKVMVFLIIVSPYLRVPLVGSSIIIIGLLAR